MIQMRAVLLAGLSMTLAPVANAQQMATPRDAARIVKLSDPHIAPDGKTVAFVETRADLEDDEFRTEIALLDMSTHVIRPLTRDRHHAASPRWSPQNDSIAFLAPDKDKTGQIWVMPLNGGDALQLTHQKKDADISGFSWSPDGSQIAFAAQDPKPDLTGEAKHRDEFQIGNDDFTLTEKPRASHVWVVGATGGAARRLTGGTWSLPTSLPPGPPSSPLQWSPDGKSIVIVRQETPSTGDQYDSRIEVVDVATGATRFLTGDPNLEGYPVLSPDGKTVAYWRYRDGKPWNVQDAWIAPFSGGHGQDISARLDKNLYLTRWLPDGKSLLVGGNEFTSVGLWQLSLDGTTRRIATGDAMPTNGYLMDIDIARNNDIILVGQTATDPFELYLLHEGAAPQRLSSENAAMSGLHLGKSETFEWHGPQNRTLDGVVTYPPDFSGGAQYPLVLLIHGGPNSASHQHFSLLPQILAARGFIVFEPNYRGSDNLDNAFFASIYKDAGHGPGEDVKSGIDALLQRGNIDRARMGVSGWSYGGYMTTWMLGHYDIWKAAVAGAAVTDWMDMYNLSDGNITITAQVGDSPYIGNGMDAYRAQSPSASYQKIKAPTLIMCDTGDFRVPITQSFSLYRALHDNHVTSAFYAFPTGGHFPGDPIRQMDVSERWADWMTKYLK